MVDLSLGGESVRVLADDFREDKIYCTLCKQTVAIVNVISHERAYSSVSSLHHRCETARAPPDERVWCTIFRTH